jgi:hypothetical protein
VEHLPFWEFVSHPSHDILEDIRVSFYVPLFSDWLSIETEFDTEWRSNLLKENGCDIATSDTMDCSPMESSSCDWFTSCDICCDIDISERIDRFCASLDVIGSGTGMGTVSEAGIGSGILFFLVFLETLIRGERPAVCRRVLTGICLKSFKKLIITPHTLT